MYAKLIKGHNDIRIYEITPYNDAPLRKHRYYVVRWDEYHAQVTSCVPNDYPPYSGTWFAGGRSAGAIQYVASGRTRTNAIKWFRKLTEQH